MLRDVEQSLLLIVEVPIHSERAGLFESKAALCEFELPSDGKCRRCQDHAANAAEQLLFEDRGDIDRCRLQKTSPAATLHPVDERFLHALHPETQLFRILFAAPIERDHFFRRILNELQFQPDQFHGTQQVPVLLIVFFQERTMLAKPAAALGGTEELKELIRCLIRHAENLIQIGDPNFCWRATAAMSRVRSWTW